MGQVPDGGGGMSELQPWQMELRGLRIGPGTPYRLRSVPEGLGTPPTRTADIAPMVDDGVYAAGDWSEQRTISAAVNIMPESESPAEVQELAHALAGAWRPSTMDLPLLMRLASDTTYMALGRPRRCELDLSTLKSGHAVAGLQFVATDPRLYGATERTITVPLGSGVMGGADFDLAFDLAFGGVSGLGQAQNDGTAETWPLVTIAGIVTDPWLENVTTGEVLRLDVTMTAANDVLVIDMRRRSITLNGANMLGAISTAGGSRFWPLIPGANLLAFRATVDTTPAVAMFTYHDASL